MRAYLAHRHRRSEEILAALDAGPATIAELVPAVYADTAKKLWRAAAGSVYAHLLHLRDLGEVEVQDDPAASALHLDAAPSVAAPSTHREDGAGMATSVTNGPEVIGCRRASRRADSWSPVRRTRLEKGGISRSLADARRAVPESLGEAIECWA